MANLSVSKLSAYAADPLRFRQAKGKAYNRKAAARGERAHQRAGSVRRWERLLIFLIILAGMVVLIWP